MIINYSGFAPQSGKQMTKLKDRILQVVNSDKVVMVYLSQTSADNLARLSQQSICVLCLGLFHYKNKNKIVLIIINII